jgi:hypothetical protein
MIAAARTEREARRVRQAQRTAARQRTLDGITGDPAGHESARGPLRPRPTAAAMEPAPLGRVPTQPAPRRSFPPRPIVISSNDDRPVSECSPDWQLLKELEDDDLFDQKEDETQVQEAMTLAQVFQRFGPKYRQRYGRTMTVQQDRALRELTACYTPLMGTHEWTCQDCGTVVDLPNACNNRHCPCCGDLKRRKWAATTASQLLPVPYYHVILTVPQQITQLAMANPGVLYPLMLKIGAEAIKRCGRKLFQVELALLSLLHTWGSLMNNHLHSHSMLPAGGLWTKGLAWIELSREQMEDLLLLVSTNFPRLFMKALRQAHAKGQLMFCGDPQLEGLKAPAGFERWLESFNTQRWVIRCPQVWDRRDANDDSEDAQKTVKYLANYANRTALSNERIEDIQGDDVLFRYKDYRDGGQWKSTLIEGVDFMGRFLQHLLPKGMHHIRRYGWMARRKGSEKFAWLEEHLRKAKPDVGELPVVAEDAEPLSEEELRSRPCRYCNGKMYLTHSTDRPRVSEILALPWSQFSQLKAGPIVTLGENVPEQAKQEQEARKSGKPARASPEKENAESSCEPARGHASVHL